MSSSSYFSEPVNSINNVWFIGDEFLERTFGKYFQSPTFENGYMRENYSSTIFAGLEKWNKSYLGRVCNALVKGINNHKCVLPKYIILVTDNELIKAVNYTGYAYNNVYIRVLQWFARQCDKIIKAAREHLLYKVKRRFEPQIISIAVPKHHGLYDNARRIQMNEAMMQVSEEFQDIKILKPIKGWDQSDIELISSSCCNYTES